MLIYVSANFIVPICDSQYDKILKTHDYFQDINIIIVFLLNIFLFYIQNTVKYYYRTCCRFYVFISQKSNFIYTNMRKLICINFEK